jgi:hypothetical protein
MAIHIRRREFVVMLGSAAVAHPLAARAQQPAMPVTGFLDSRSPDAIGFRLSGFVIEYRWAKSACSCPHSRTIRNIRPASGRSCRR